MPNAINIFISYKMPKAEEVGGEKVDIAEEFAKELSDFSAGLIKIHYAGSFAAGIDWRNELISTIQKCDMFILLYTGAEQQWEFCLLEAGLFQATHPTRPLVVLHDPATTRPAALAQLNSVKVTVEHMTDFLSPIFYDEPWSISPTLSRARLTEIATDLVRVFHSESSTATNFDLVPSFILEMGASETTRNELRSGKIPDNTKLKGSQNWQMLFDKGAVIQALKWSDLKNWPVKKFYDLKFSRMALTALSKDTPGGCFIRPSIQEQGGILYRVALRRYEEYANDTGWRFHFTAAPIDIPIFGIGDTTDNDETRNYHLLNVCWYTRRRLILILHDRAEILVSSATATLDEKNALVAEIQDELANINIQSFIRRIDHPATLGDILPLKEIQDDQKAWVRNTSIIDKYDMNSDEAFNEVVAALREMKAMNRKYYSISAGGFARAVAGELANIDK
jgi:hypothetical protein